jgi:hypothetical protein
MNQGQNHNFKVVLFLLLIKSIAHFNAKIGIVILIAENWFYDVYNEYGISVEI